jgi:cyanate permease
VVPLVTASIEIFGWRQTCLLWAVLLLLLTPIPFVWFRAERLNPTTVEPPLSADIALPEPPDSKGVRWTLRQPAFWIIAVALTAQASVTAGLSLHLLPMMTDFGIDPVMAGALFGGMILLSIPVRLLAGYISDRVAPHMLPCLLAGLLVLEGLAIGSFAVAPGFATMLVVIGSLGIAAGAPMVLVLVLCNELFGQRTFGAVQGSLMMIQVPGTMLAPIVAGYVHDVSGSYAGVIAGFSILLVLGGTLLSLVKRPR